MAVTFQGNIHVECFNRLSDKNYDPGVMLDFVFDDYA